MIVLLKWLRQFFSNSDLKAEMSGWLSPMEAALYASKLAGRAVSVRTLLKFARRRKIRVAMKFADDRGNEHVFEILKLAKGANLRRVGFHKISVSQFVDAHRIFQPLSESDHTSRISETVASRRVADSKFFPGEIISKADAAFILGCSRRGIEYLMDVGQLKPISLGHRTVVFRQKKVRALERQRRPRSGKRKARYAGNPIDGRRVGRMVSPKSIAA
jgi:hypothetical protein